jgi:hypothetical protein
MPATCRWSSGYTPSSHGRPIASAPPGTSRANEGDVYRTVCCGNEGRGGGGGGEGGGGGALSVHLRAYGCSHSSHRRGAMHAHRQTGMRLQPQRTRAGCDACATTERHAAAATAHTGGVQCMRADRQACGCSHSANRQGTQPRARGCRGAAQPRANTLQRLLGRNREDPSEGGRECPSSARCSYHNTTLPPPPPSTPTHSPRECCQPATGRRRRVAAPAADRAAPA